MESTTIHYDRINVELKLQALDELAEAGVRIEE